MKSLLRKKAFWVILVIIGVVLAVLLSSSHDVGGDVPDWTIWLGFVLAGSVGLCIAVAIYESITK